MMTDENLNDEMTLLDIPVGTVPLSYIMDPETDDLLDGSELKNGMIVLIESVSMRENPEGTVRVFGMPTEALIEIPDEVKAMLKSPYSEVRIQETSRWCRVTRLKVYDNIDSFIGLYADGTKMSRQYHEHYYWLVKKSSIERV
jgi:hypothetical protein